MARHITVYRREDLAFLRSPPKDVNSPEFDLWSEEANRRCLFDAPLGSESTVREFWSAPAHDLALPLLVQIYDWGFYDGIEWAAEQLDQAEAELLQLESHWNTLDLDPKIAEDLRERLVSLRSAIAIARQVDGVLTID
jgi:hypothetical protein